MKNKIFLIEKELANLYNWAKGDFTRALWRAHWSTNDFFNNWAKTLRIRKEYTRIFNKTFKKFFVKKFSVDELFSLIDNK
jgi:hypothetical protein